jgi:hypothetical protein
MAKIEAGDPSVSPDLIVRALFAAGATRRELQPLHKGAFAKLYALEEFVIDNNFLNYA